MLDQAGRRPSLRSLRTSTSLHSPDDERLNGLLLQFRHNISHSILDDEICSWTAHLRLDREQNPLMNWACRAMARACFNPQRIPSPPGVEDSPEPASNLPFAPCAPRPRKVTPRLISRRQLRTGSLTRSAGSKRLGLEPERRKGCPDPRDSSGPSLYQINARNAGVTETPMMWLTVCGCRRGAGFLNCLERIYATLERRCVFRVIGLDPTVALHWPIRYDVPLQAGMGT